MMLIDDLFEMGSGYVLNFSDRTFAQFVAEELNIDIDDPVYATNGTSKAKRLRCFLQTVDKPTAARTLTALWEYREALRQRAGRDAKRRSSTRTASFWPSSIGSALVARMPHTL